MVSFQDLEARQDVKLLLQRVEQLEEQLQRRQPSFGAGFTGVKIGRRP